MSNSLGGLVCNFKKQNLYNIRNKLKERIILVFQGSKILQNKGSQNNPTPTVFKVNIIYKLRNVRYLKSQFFKQDFLSSL